MTGPWEFTCPHCGSRANSLHMCGGPSDSGGTGIIPELNASSRLAELERECERRRLEKHDLSTRAEERIAALERKVAALEGKAT